MRVIRFCRAIQMSSTLLLIFVLALTLGACTRKTASSELTLDSATSFVADIRSGDSKKMAAYLADPDRTVALARKVIERGPAGGQSSDFILVLGYIDGEILQSVEPARSAPLSREIISSIISQPRDDLSETAFGHALARATEYHLKAGEDSRFKAYLNELATTAPAHFVSFAIQSGLAPAEMGLQKKAREIAGVAEGTSSAASGGGAAQ